MFVRTKPSERKRTNDGTDPARKHTPKKVCLSAVYHPLPPGGDVDISQILNHSTVGKASQNQQRPVHYHATSKNSKFGGKNGSSVNHASISNYDGNNVTSAASSSTYRRPHHASSTISNFDSNTVASTFTSSSNFKPGYPSSSTISNYNGKSVSSLVSSQFRPIHTSSKVSSIAGKSVKSTASSHFSTAFVPKKGQPAAPPKKLDSKCSLM